MKQKRTLSLNKVRSYKPVVFIISHADFEIWKREYEENCNTYFIRKTGTKGCMQYYYCNRSGYFNTRGKGMRNIKSQGTSKLNTYCTATITTTTDNKTGEVYVTVCHTHYGHDLQLGHIPLGKCQRIYGNNFD